MDRLEIYEVKSRRDLRDFIRFPFSLYKNSPYWIPPLIRDEFTLFDRQKNPAFEICKFRQWLVRTNDKVVGRIAGIIHDSEAKATKTGRFGWIDFVDDPRVSKLLFDGVENWFKEEGFKHIHGPFGFCDMDPEGMLVEGFKSPATIATIYNYPYYPEHLENLGYNKSADWIEWICTIPELPDRMLKAASLVERRYKVKSRRGQGKKEMISRSHEMFNVLNDSFQDLHGFQALTSNQIEFYRDKYLNFVDPEFMSIVFDKNDEIVAFGIAMPSLSEAFQKARGRLLPFGAFHILRGLKQRKEIDLYLIGVRPDYQRTGIVSLIFRDLHTAFNRHGFLHARSKAILEDNNEALSIFNEYEDWIEIHKRRRCFKKKLN